MELKREIHPNLAIIYCTGNTSGSRVDFSPMSAAGCEYPVGTMMTVTVGWVQA